MINVVIVDDEPLALEGMTNYVREIDSLRLIGSCENPIELMAILEKEDVDLIFLDIQMPKMNGLDFIKVSKNLPSVIITTAYPNYAVEGFDLNVLDYLLKPITFKRFVQSVQKAKTHLSRGKNAVIHGLQKKEGHFFIKSEGKYEKIYFNDILYIQGLQNYVVIHTIQGQYTALLTLKGLEENLDSKGFIRVHKSFIVAIARVEALENHKLRIRETTIPISKNYRDNVLEKVIEGKLWKR
ncbi:LytTR family DNA-binding domain-containing protein [Flavobacteriaceae bacterium GF1]